MMGNDWMLFTTHFAIPVIIGGALVQLLVQMIGGWIDGK